MQGVERVGAEDAADGAPEEGRRFAVTAAAERAAVVRCLGEVHRRVRLRHEAGHEGDRVEGRRGRGSGGRAAEGEQGGGRLGRVHRQLLVHVDGGGRLL